MCVANLNLTTSPCSHRWYQLVRPCEPANDLSNCSQKLRLEGWESRVDHCPFCSSTNTSNSTHRLFGSTSSASSSTSSPTDPLAMTLRRTSTSTRRGSIATLPSSGASTPLSPLSRQSSGGSGNYFTNNNSTSDADRAQRSRDMNDRILMYLSSEPHQVLPSGRKHYPTYANFEEGGGTTTTTAASSISDGMSSAGGNGGGLGRTKERIGRGWKRMSGRFMLKGV